MLTVGCVRSWGHDLAGPPPIEGTRVRQDTELRCTDVAVIFKKEDIFEKGRAAWDHATAIDIEVLEKPTTQGGKIKVRHVIDLLAMRKNGENAPEESQTDLGPFHGQSLLLQRVGNSWKADLISGQPDADQERELSHYSSPLDHWYAPGAHRVGDYWQVSGTRLAGIVGENGATSFDGTAKFVFDGVVQKGGEACARVRASFEYRCTQAGETANVELWMVYSGTVYRSLVSYLDVDIHFAGGFTMRQRSTVEGEKSSLTASGKLTIESAQRRKMILK